MSAETAHETLRRAAAGTLDQIRADRDEAPPRLKPLLAYIEAHLFDSHLTVQSIKEACGVRDNSIAIQFHACLGQPPHAYFTRHRMQVATHLLRDSALPIWQISHLIGFSSIQVFSRAFFRLLGVRPSVYRQQRPNPAEGGAVGPVVLPARSVIPHSDPSDRDTEFWRRALEGRLEDREAENLIRRLLEIYPPGRSSRN
jgi:AraC-like DNA-binding protein